MMKKCCFIIPYFGKLPKNFQLFLDSCGYNGDFNWIIFTDDDSQFEYPVNVQRIMMQFSELQKLIFLKFDFKPQIDSPYKLCDYKPAYGYLFEEYIKGYQFWGHCDCDLIWGRLSDFITDDMLKGYDKIFTLGHCIIYKNTFEINRVFMKDCKGKERYKEVYQNNEQCAFDEEYLPNNVNTIFLQHGYKVFEDDYSANLKVNCTDFRVTRFDKITRSYLNEDKNDNFFVFDNGVLKRYYMRFNELYESEYMYIHFQRRAMINLLNERKAIYKIAPNSFDTLEKEVTKDTFKEIKKRYKNNHMRNYYKYEIKFWKKRIFNKLFHQVEK